MKRRAAGLGLIVSAIVIVGCSGSSGSRPTVAPTTAAPTITAPSTPQQLAADTALAQHAVLEQRDVPVGFEATPRSKQTTDVAAQKRLAKCLGVSSDLVTKNQPGRVRIEGPTFVQRLNSSHLLEVGSVVVVKRSTAGTQKQFSALTGAQGVSCQQAFLRERFAADKRLAASDVRDLTLRTIPMVAVGDQRGAFEGKFTLSASGQPIDATFDYFFVRRGRAVAEIATVAFSTSFLPNVTNSLIEKVASRLAAAS